MSSICPKCGKFMESNVCEFCQDSIESKESLEKQKMRDKVGVLKKKLVLSAGITVGIVVIFAVLLILISMSSNDNSPSNNYHKSESYNSYENADVPNDNENTTNNCFYVLKDTDGSGLFFNMTLTEFMENYNQLIAEYANTYTIVDEAFIVEADFKKQNNSQRNVNGVLCDTYICYSTLFGYNKNYAICVNVEKNSHCISDVSIAIDSNFFMNLSNEQRVLNTMQNHIVERSLIDELTSEYCYDIDEQIQQNSNNGFVPAHYDKGVSFSLDSSYVSSIGVLYFRIQPCTEEQWKTAPGFKDISID